MQLQVNEKHEITGYATVGGFVGGIEAEASSLPESFEKSFAPSGVLWKARCAVCVLTTLICSTSIA